MTNKYQTGKFDLRPVDFQSGKRLAATASEKIECQCCGRKIAKGIILNTSERIGTECGVVGDLLRYRNQITRRDMAILQISEKQTTFFGVTVAA